MRKIVMLSTVLVTGLLAGGLFVAGGSRAADANEITVYKSPFCGCCKSWEKHMEANGFTVKSVAVDDLRRYKSKYGVADSLASCHTAVIDGYVVEGHVPAADVKRMLKERPAIRGLAVPGMPSGSPGMEQGYNDPYDVLTFDKKGNLSVYSRHP
ncbi:MAG: DUF411 domain-containing protein [Gammaproteobacteria bacterium]|nr:DUF411 domain-containing protein [Gammaproteobacteria bacterium]